MKVQFSIVGAALMRGDEARRAHWAEMDAIPQVGDAVQIGSLPQYETMVRTVVWYPFGDPEANHDGPFVYVVLGERVRWTGKDPKERVS